MPKYTTVRAVFIADMQGDGDDDYDVLSLPLLLISSPWSQWVPRVSLYNARTLIS